MNKALLCKWLWRFNSIIEKGLWKIIISQRYRNRKVLTNLSPLWKEVIRENDIYNIGINKVVEDGKNTLFWHDRWILDCALKSHFPLLFEMASNQEITVAEVIGFNRYYLLFNSNLNVILRHQLTFLYTLIINVNITTSSDVSLWRWCNNGLFSVHSCYYWLDFGGVK
jgi:hypothetical protein